MVVAEGRYETRLRGSEAKAVAERLLTCRRVSSPVLLLCLSEIEKSLDRYITFRFPTRALEQLTPLSFFPPPSSLQARK